MDTEAGKSIEPGMPGNPVKLTDPKMMRALAHPARIAIWSHIGLRGSVTATECAEVAGLSPSACSYHLRTLARYGFIEEDRASAANGRERPWSAPATWIASPSIRRTGSGRRVRCSARRT
jgi:DNA-binding transcriptional ArsR family regulator